MLFPPLKIVSLVCLFLAAACTAATASVQYQAIDLYTFGHSGDLSGPNSGVTFGGQVVGSESIDPNIFLPRHAILWDRAGSRIDLHPTDGTFNSSAAYATDGAQQVGVGLIGTVSHALLWSGNAASVVDLNPTGMAGASGSVAFGLGNGEQVGAVNALSHAFLWRGTAASARDLNPAQLGIVVSMALATDGTQQVGSGESPSFSNDHALLWNGTAESAVDLNPAGSLQSFAYGVSGGQQVGQIAMNVPGRGTVFHATLWTGSATSAVDLQPTNLFFPNSIALGTNGRFQVGVGDTGGNTGNSALLWAGTPDSAVNLGALLTGFSNSTANSIDDAGNVFGIGYDNAGKMHAIEWVPAPEPATPLAFVMLGALALRREQRRSIAAEGGFHPTTFPRSPSLAEL